ncbi:MAG: MBL fold metallo-hydrolase [Clostridia bacterium]|nr:MBL fold metallo-hydrolase [Clostridia bacterium]
MKFESLASSSHGNAYIVSDSDTRILLECGVSHKQLQKLAGFSLSDIKACLVSHEHKDHARCVDELIKRGMEVYMSYGTARALENESATLIENMEQFNVGSLDIVPFTTFHDAAEPLGFLIKSRIDGDVLAFATDTVNLRYKFPGLNILAIEANYDRKILDRCEKLPEKVRHRITNSHMEIETLCDYLRSLDLSECREIHLLHLSDAMSDEGGFMRKVLWSIPKGIEVKACEK